MQKYFAYMRIGIKEHLAYPSSIGATFLSRIIYLYMQFCLWNALFSSQAKTSLAMGREDTLRYVIAATVISTFMECNAIQWINGQIQSGNIAVQLIRPISFSAMLFARHFGTSAVKCILYSVPLTVIAACFFKQPLCCLPQLPAALLSVLLAYLIQFLYSLIIGLMAFWLIVTWPLNMLLGAVYKLLSGSWIPAAMFPDALKTVNTFLPFRAMYEIPVSILTVPMDGKHIASKLAVQVFWLTFLFVLKNVTWKTGTKKLVVQGG